MNRMKRLIKMLFVFFAFFVFCCLDEINVNAYKNVCNEQIVRQEKGNYFLCGDNIIFLMKENTKLSSYIIVDNEMYADNQILYAGKIDGLDTFYTLSFRYYSVVYDERGMFSSNDDVYSDISINGVVVYSGDFEDSALINQSKEGFVGTFYNEVGNYLIRQYVGNDIVNAIRVIVVNNEDYSLGVESISLGNLSVNEKNIVYKNQDLNIKVTGGKYGFDNDVNVEVNNCLISTQFNKNMIIKSDEFSGCLIDNENNYIKVTLTNGLGIKKTFKYNLNLVSGTVSVKMKDTIVSPVASSRRILINAIAGKGNVLDNSKCLYYWSKSSNDKLTYDDFMANYEESENTGIYSSNKGVILRDKEGTYYLYALAMDNVSSIVVRSDKYILQEHERVSKVILKDYIFMITLCLGATLPILIYVFIRGKDTF